MSQKSELPTGAQPAGSIEKTGEQPKSTFDYITSDISRQQLGLIWRNAERAYIQRLTKKNGNKRFAVDSLDFYMLHVLAGAPAWATYDALHTLLSQLESAGLLTHSRGSDEVTKAVADTWVQMSQAPYMGDLIQVWGEVSPL